MTQFIARTSKEIIEAVYFDGSDESQEEFARLASVYGVLDVSLGTSERNDSPMVTVGGRGYSEDMYFIWNEAQLGFQPSFVSDFVKSYVKLTPANEKYGKHI